MKRPSRPPRAFRPFSSLQESHSEVVVNRASSRAHRSIFGPHVAEDHLARPLKLLHGWYPLHFAMGAYSMR